MKNDKCLRRLNQFSRMGNEAPKNATNRIWIQLVKWQNSHFHDWRGFSRKKVLYGLSSHSAGEIFRVICKWLFENGNIFQFDLFVLHNNIHEMIVMNVENNEFTSIKRQSATNEETSSVTLMENFELRNANRFIGTLFIDWVVLLFSMTDIDRQNFIVIPIRSFLSQ